MRVLKRDTSIRFSTLQSCFLLFWSTLKKGFLRENIPQLFLWFSFVNLNKSSVRARTLAVSFCCPQPRQQMHSGWISERICLWWWDSGLGFPLRISGFIGPMGGESFPNLPDDKNHLWHLINILSPWRFWVSDPRWGPRIFFVDVWLLWVDRCFRWF